MKTLTAGLLTILGVAVFAASAETAAPTQVTLTAPPAVELGEEIQLDARLLTADGRPVPGAALQLLQVGAVGVRMIAQATTDAQGSASFVHREYTVPALTLRVAFPGSPVQAAAHADVSVTVSGVEVKPSVVMIHSPGLAVKTTLFLLLGGVWLTYMYAASRVARVALEGRTIPKGGRAR